MKRRRDSSLRSEWQKVLGQFPQSV